MAPLADWQIRDLAMAQAVIEPFVNGQARHGGVSHGLTSYGYDLRNDGRWRVQRAPWSRERMQHADAATRWDEIAGDLVLGPGDFALCGTLEYVRVPRDCVVIMTGKSTWARRGVHILVTPLEPAWEGHVTVEVRNLGWEPHVIAAGCGIGQALFFRGEAPPEVSYADRGGRYQAQGPGPVHSVEAV